MQTPPATDALDLRTIGTPSERCLTVDDGAVPRDPLLAELRAGDFDQAPVMQSGRPVGVILVVELQRLAERDEVVRAEALSSAARRTLEVASQRGTLLAALAASRGVIAVEGNDWWLVTISDLNRQRFRSSLYATFAELEALVARMIDLTYPDDPWLWLANLRPDVQARLVGYWEMGKRKGVDIGPQAGAMLSEMLDVVEASADLRASLGFPSRSQFKKFTGDFPVYRNSVMHPVRPLVSSSEEVAAIHGSLERAAALIARCRGDLARRGASSRLPWL